MTVLFVLIVAGALVSVGLCVEMSRRNESMLGLTALGLLMAVAVLGTVYAAFAAE